VADVGFPRSAKALMCPKPPSSLRKASSARVVEAGASSARGPAKGNAGPEVRGAERVAADSMTRVPAEWLREDAPAGAELSISPLDFEAGLEGTVAAAVATLT
jgi:hypothetical protein